MGRRKKAKRTHGVVYLVTNTVNGKQYVGYTVQLLKDRWKQHWKDAEAGRGWALHAAIRKYGKGTFTIEPLTELMPEHLLPQIEIFHIYLYKSLVSEGGYNVTLGGDGVPCTDEMRKKMSESQKRRGPITEATRAKLRGCQVGKIISPEHRLAVSKAQTGRVKSQEEIDLVRSKTTGRKRSQVTKQKMRDAAGRGETHHMWGKHESAETKAKKSASLLKHYETNTKPPVTAETRANMSTSRRASTAVAAHMKALNKSRRGKPAHNRGAKHSEETKAKMKAGWVLLNQKRAVAKMKSMVKAHLLTLAKQEILA